jgi:hypothetical protein
VARIKPIAREALVAWIKPIAQEALVARIKPIAREAPVARIKPNAPARRARAPARNKPNVAPGRRSR